ncbi:hypothetical protein [Metabacillus litoralis]|uniref:hypothetical protein n=1 Tax=Metabacillus litoralis TaxID=152268 RepID=UPI00203C6DCE|nr:hypothetical protein [Metabacillus litoralis]MCM3411445.1 hypothetical protein [Metabacillus litoralis]
MIEGKGLGNKKVNRVNMSLSNKYNFKLNRLATACNLKPTTLAGMLVELSLDNPELIEKLQSEYCTYSTYRVLPVKKGNEVEYLLEDKTV